MKRQITIFIFLYFILTGFSIAQTGNFTFTIVENPNGKRLGKINDITQDKRGYMWFAGNGDKCIYRYDGNRMISFRQDSLNTNSLRMTNLEKIYADDSGKIWIGGDGLDMYNPATGIFKHYRHDKNDTMVLRTREASSVSNSLIDDGVMAILKDRKGRVWIGTNKGLDCLDEKTGKFIHYRNVPDNPKSLSDDVVNTIYEDRHGDIWVGTGWRWFGFHPTKGGLNRLNPDGSFTRYMNDPKNPKSLINNKVNAIFEDSRGIFWIGTNGFGINIMDKENGSFERLPYSLKDGDTTHGLPFQPEMINNPVTFIREDSTGAIWIGTRGYGINRYDTSTKTFTHLQYSNGFPEGSPWCAYISRDGVLWTGTEGANLYYADPAVRAISNISIGPMGMVATDFIEDKDGSYWVGSDGTGLLHFNQQDKLLHHYTSEISDVVHNPMKSISSMAQYKDTIYLGLLEGGMVRFNSRRHHFSSLRYDGTKKDSNINNVGALSMDKDGYLWIARWSGLLRYNPRDGSVKYFHPDAKDTTTISTDRTGYVFHGSSGDLWVGGFRAADEKGINFPALNLMNRKTGQFSRYLKGSIIGSIYEDSDGTIWTNTSTGFYSLKKGEDHFTPFNLSESTLEGSHFLGIVEDNRKYLWINTTSAILKLNPERNKIFIYGKKYGIMPNNISNAIRKFSNGKLFIGNNQGFYSFFPEELDIKTPHVNIIITGMFINNLPVAIGERQVLTRPIEDITTLTLSHKQNNFGFDFAADDYREPGATKFFTKLENYDSIWREAKGDKSAYYFYVRPGDYVFRVKAVTVEGTEIEKAISIRVNPPWWQTWWAYTLYGLLALCTILMIYRIQKQRIIQKERQKAQQVELAQAKEIEKAYHELKSTQALLIQSEKMASLGELTAGIAHEIQNPLNFVNNFSDLNQELVDELKEENEKGNTGEVNIIADTIKDNEAKINFHGKRADAIVKNMLQHSRTSSGLKEPTDINALADEYLRLAYHGYRAKEKTFNATLQTDFDPAIGMINVISQDVGRLLLNLYNNAFYAVMEKQKTIGQSFEPAIKVSSKMETGSHTVLISVQDNGLGIPQKMLDKIFQPFFTTKPTGQGTGLGLSLSYDIIKAHHGEIKVDTREGEYTSFIISLPAT